MKTIFISFLFSMVSVCSFSQIYMTRNGRISFFSATDKETINAANNQVYAVIDAGKNNIAFALLMKSFQFEKELMQEHFNENYAESDKFPKASFNGSYSGDVNVAKDGVYKVMVTGNLTIHNVTKPVEEPATLEVKNNTITGKAQFKIKPEEYAISIPSLVREKIAKEMTIDVMVNCSPK